MIEKTVVRLILGVCLPVASAVVIEQLPKTGVAEVPFAFQMEDQTLPPGTYAVKQADGGRAICVQNEEIANGDLNCMAAKSKFGRAQGQGARLGFEHDAGRYFLVEIWFEADGRGLILRRGGEEQQSAIRYVRFQ
jgi:hypothetical protein